VRDYLISGPGEKAFAATGGARLFFSFSIDLNNYEKERDGETSKKRKVGKIVVLLGLL